MKPIGNNKFIDIKQVFGVEFTKKGNITILLCKGFGSGIGISEKDFDSVSDYETWQKELCKEFSIKQPKKQLINTVKNSIVL